MSVSLFNVLNILLFYLTCTFVFVFNRLKKFAILNWNIECKVSWVVNDGKGKIVILLVLFQKKLQVLD